MSKAFTREDDAGLEPPKPGPARARVQLTAMGQGVLHEQLESARQAGDAAAIASIETRLAGGVIGPPEDPLVAGLGAEVTLRDAAGRARVVRIVTPEEVGLVPKGASPASPLAAAIVGARQGDPIEMNGPSGPQELVVVTIAWPTGAATRSR